MDQLRRVIDTIRTNISKLNPSQQLAIMSAAVVGLMVLFLISQYAGSPDMVELTPGATAEEIQLASQTLSQAGIEAESRDGTLFIHEQDRPRALASLAQNQAMPGNSVMLFESIAHDNGGWMKSADTHRQNYNIALQNELALVIRQFPSVREATVLVDNPKRVGMGHAARVPTASVTVFTGSAGSLTKDTVNALGSLVAGSVAGLKTENVSIIDGTTGRRYRAQSDNSFIASSYLEHVQQFEKQVHEKLLDHLAYIPGVSVAVTAIIDADYKETRDQHYHPSKEGSVSMVVSESRTESSTGSSSNAAEPGVQPNTQLSINTASSSDTTSRTEDTNTILEAAIGKREDHIVHARGKPKRINVSINVPEEWVEAYVKRTLPDGEEPTPDLVDQQWLQTRTDLVAQVGTLIQTENQADEQIVQGDVIAQMVPMALASAGSIGMPSSGSAGGVGSLLGPVGTVATTGIVKYAFLGLLALVSVFMMVMTVRRAGKVAPLPSAEELVGIPPALQRDSDLVGEADEGDAAMTGIEVDETAIKRKRMLEEVSELVKANPSTTAGIMKQWLEADS